MDLPPGFNKDAPQTLHYLAENENVPLNQDIFLCPGTLPDRPPDPSLDGGSSGRGSVTTGSRRSSAAQKPERSWKQSGTANFQGTPSSIGRMGSAEKRTLSTGETDWVQGLSLKGSGNFQNAFTRKAAPQVHVIKWYYYYSSRIVNNKVFVGFTTVLTVYALTGDDFRLLATDKPADIVFNILTIFCLLAFSLEILLSCLGKEDYFMGFFFGLDAVSTVTLILDLTWVSEHIVGDEDDFDKARSGRTARMGARVGRIVRVIRLIRIVKLYKVWSESRARSKKQRRRCSTTEPGEDDEDWGDMDDNQAQNADNAHRNESLVGKKLSAVTTRRVIILVLTMLLVLPLLVADDSAMLPASPAYGADDIHEAFLAMSRGEGSRLTYERALLRYEYYHNWFVGHGDCPRTAKPKICSNAYLSNVFWTGISSTDWTRLQQMAIQAKLRAETVEAWDRNASVQDDIYNYGTMPSAAVQILSSPWTTRCESKKTSNVGFSLLTKEALNSKGYVVKCPSDLRIVERAKWSPRAMTLEEYQTWHFAFYFDVRPSSRAESAFSLITTLFVCLVLCVASVFFSKDANTLVLEPVEAMISKVNKIKNDPLLAMKMADDEFKQEEIAKMKQKKMNKEWLMKTVRNLVACKSEHNEVLETVILDKTIIKLGTLLALGFGEAGTNIVSQNLGSNLSGVNAMMEGTRIDCILGNAWISDFSTATEVLQGKVMTFVNQVAEIVHGVIDEYAGAANKNNGDTFLLIWRLGAGMDTPEAQKCADMAMCAFAKVLGAVHRSPVLASYRGHPGLQQRLGHHCRVNLCFGLHQGWAIEGAVGTEFKIDASYLSPHVSIATSVAHATTIYGVPFVVSQAVVDLSSKEMAGTCRLIDTVIIKGSSSPICLYSLDLDFMSLQVDEPKRRYYVWNLRQRYRARQLLEAEKNRKWQEEVSISSIFNESPDISIMRRRYTTEFLQLFNMGYQNYVEGEWIVARRLLSHTQNALGIKDGPSMALLRFMEIPYQFEAPLGWAGVHEFGDVPRQRLSCAEATEFVSEAMELGHCP